MLFDATAIAGRVRELAETVSTAYAAVTADDPLVILVVLNGAQPFASDLVRLLRVPVVVDAVRLTSYTGSASSGVVTWLSAPEIDIAGRRVLIVEDVVDTGRTLSALRDAVATLGAAEIHCVALLDKPGCRVVRDGDPDWCGWMIDDHFVVGYGLDLDGRLRDLDHLAVADLCQARGLGERVAGADDPGPPARTRPTLPDHHADHEEHRRDGRAGL